MMIPASVLSVSSGSTQQLIAGVLPERPEWWHRFSHTLTYVSVEAPFPKEDIPVDTTVRGLDPCRGSVLLYWESCSTSVFLPAPSSS